MDKDQNTGEKGTERVGQFKYYKTTVQIYHSYIIKEYANQAKVKVCDKKYRGGCADLLGKSRKRTGRKESSAATCLVQGHYKEDEKKPQCGATIKSKKKQDKNNNECPITTN
jgi:hypothetical protein